MIKTLLKKVLTVFLSACIAVSAFAQITTSSMSGKVTDASGPIAGVAVVASHQPTGSTFYALTDAAGRFYLNNITSGGPYKVTLSCLGYTDVIYEGITVSLSDNFVINAEMKEEYLRSK